VVSTSKEVITKKKGVHEEEKCDKEPGTQGIKDSIVFWNTLLTL